MNNASAVVKWAGCGAALMLAGAPLAVAEDAAVLDSVIITADQERADGPVQGYRANRPRSATKNDTPIEEIPQRSEERRVGQEGGRTCRSRGAPAHSQKKIRTH